MRTKTPQAQQQPALSGEAGLVAQPMAASPAGIRQDGGSEAGLLLLNPMDASPAGIGGSQSRLVTPVRVVASTRAGNEVSAKAGLIGVFLPLRSCINK